MENYRELFKELIQSAEVLAERVLEYNHDKKDESGERAASQMRDDYMALREKISSDAMLTKNDYLKILLAAMVISNNLETMIERQQKSLDNYKVAIIPKLQRIAEECKTDEEAVILANEIFSTNN